MTKRVSPPTCAPKAGLLNRPRMTYEQAAEVEALFAVLANDTRLWILQEIATQGEASPLEIAEALEMKPQAISNQLQRLHDKGIVANRRDGNNVYYRIVNQCVIILLERALCLIEEEAKRGAN